MSLKIKLPNNVRCALALTYDVEMCAGYSPDGINHGRLGPFLMKYMLRLCETAEDYGVFLHFFQVVNGLEVNEVVLHLKEVIRRGHAVDCHTYNHVNLAYTPTQELNNDLALANRLFEKHLGYRSIILRGPGGYRHNALEPENQQVILNNGYKWISGE